MEQPRCGSHLGCVAGWSLRPPLKGCCVGESWSGNPALEREREDESALFSRLLTFFFSLLLFLGIYIHSKMKSKLGLSDVLLFW